jgi:hypothetical protein
MTMTPEIQSELFERTPVTGPLHLDMPDAEVLLFDRFFDGAESGRHFEALAGGVPWQQDEFTIHGKTIPVPRLTAWYGDDSKHLARIIHESP